MREVCYENNNYRIQVWNVEIRREEGGEREHTWYPLSTQAGEVGGGGVGGGGGGGGG